MVIENEKIYIDLPKTIAGTALLTGMAVLVKGLVYLPASLALAAVLLMVAETDALKRRIPNSFVMLMVLPGILLLITELYLGAVLKWAIVTRVIGIFALSVPLLLAAVITNGGVGGGDIKFIAASGFVLGALRVAYAVFAGMCVASVFILAGGIYRSLAKRAPGYRRIPAGPFFAVGIWIVYLLF